MNVKYGKSTDKYGPGVEIHLTGDDVALAIYAFLVARGVNVSGPRTVMINEELCQKGLIYVDPSGWVDTDEKWFSGRGPEVKNGE